jgi:hypothetical protein
MEASSDYVLIEAKHTSLLKVHDGEGHVLREGLPGAGGDLLVTHGVKGLPGDDVAAELIDDGHQGRCAFPCLDIGDVCGAELVGEEDLPALPQIRGPSRLPAGCREQAAGADTYELSQPVSG